MRSTGNSKATEERSQEEKSPIDALEPVADKLLTFLRRQDCVAWVGSGFSHFSGFPSWEDAVKKLCSDCGVPSVSLPADQPEILMAKAEECKRADVSRYECALAAMYGGDVTGARYAIRHLFNLPFRAIVTTNFDPILVEEVGFVADGTQPPVFYYPDLPSTALGRHTKAVFYMHGCARMDGKPCGHNLVLSSSEFAEAYDIRLGSTGQFVMQILRYHPVLFLGCKLREPPIRDIFRRVRQMRELSQGTASQTDQADHMVLLHGTGESDPIRKNEEQEEDQEFRRQGIQALRYQSNNDQHREIEAIFSRLNTKLKTNEQLDSRASGGKQRE
jgi:hypothetical protein